VSKSSDKNSRIESLAQVRAMFDRKVAWFLGETEQVNKLVDQIIQEHTSDLVASALGMKRQWGRWEFDFQNQKSIPLLQFIQKESDAAAKRWVKDKLATFFQTELTEKALKGLRADFLQSYYDKIYAIVREEAVVKAEKDAKDLIKRLMSEPIPSIDSLPRKAVLAGLEEDEQEDDGDEPSFDNEEDDEEPDDYEVNQLFKKPRQSARTAKKPAAKRKKS
jgi:hypothetical protein